MVQGGAVAGQSGEGTFEFALAFIDEGRRSLEGRQGAGNDFAAFAAASRDDVHLASALAQPGDQVAGRERLVIGMGVQESDAGGADAEQLDGF